MQEAIHNDAYPGYPGRHVPVAEGNYRGIDFFIDGQDCQGAPYGYSITAKDWSAPVFLSEGKAILSARWYIDNADRDRIRGEQANAKNKSAKAIKAKIAIKHGRPRDNQRQRVYSAERTLKGGVGNYGGRFKTVAEMQAWVDKINDSRWLKGYIKKHPRGISRKIITVKDGRGRRHACAETFMFTANLKMPTWSRSKLVLLHEMAHVYTPNYAAWHGPDFCAVYLDFVRRWLGKDAHAELKSAFSRGRVKHRRS